mgnify:CR=1 FL=1
MIKIYTTNWWGPCTAAKKLLDDIGLSYENIDIEEKGISREELEKITGGYTVPQIIINNKTIGGFSELIQLYQKGELKELNNEWKYKWKNT